MSTTHEPRPVRPLGQPADAEPVAPTPNRRRLGPGQIIGLGAAGVGLIGAGFFGAKAMGGGEDAPRPETSTSSVENPGEDTAPEVEYSFSDPLVLEVGAFNADNEADHGLLNESGGLVQQSSEYLQACIDTLKAGGDVADIPTDTVADSPDNPAVLAIQQLAQDIIDADPADGSELMTAAVGPVYAGFDDGTPSEAMSEFFSDSEGVIQTTVGATYLYGVPGGDVQPGATSVDYDGAVVVQSPEGNLIFSQSAN